MGELTVYFINISEKLHEIEKNGSIMCLCGEVVSRTRPQINHQINEMVSLGDTAISPHILQPPLMVGGGGLAVFWEVKT